MSVSATPISPNDETAQTLARLRRENGLQEGVLRGLKADVLPRSFSTSGSLRVTAGSSISYFHVEGADGGGRRWNFEFQQLCAAPLEVSGAEGVRLKIASINAFLAIFTDAMVALARRFLDQYLGEDDSGMELASEPMPDGITIALLDCEERTHLSAAGKEQRAQYRLLSQQIALCGAPLVCVSPRALVSWKGRLLVVSADIIAASEPMVADECLELRTALELVSETLNFRRYCYGGGSTGEEQMGAGPADATAVRGPDGRVYAHNMHGLYPYFPPARGATVDPARHKVHLLPELLTFSGGQQALSPAAFVTFGASDSAARNSEVRDAVARMCQQLVPQCAAALIAEADGMAKAPKLFSDPSILVNRLHRSGINLACLAAFFYSVASRAEGAKSSASALALARLAWTEMCARALRDVVQLDMSRRIEGSEVCEAVGEVLAQLAEDPATFQKQTLLPLLVVKFVGLASFMAAGAGGIAVDADGVPSAAKYLDTALLVGRAMGLLGVTLKPLPAGALPSDPNVYEVTAMAPVAKPLTLPRPAIGRSAFYAEAADNNNSITTFSSLGAEGGLGGRLAAIAAGTPQASAAYLAGREKELTAARLFPDLPSPCVSSSYIYACHDMAAMLNAHLTGAGGACAFPTGVAALCSQSGAAAPRRASPPADVGVAMAKEAVAVATNGITLMRDSPISSGAVFLKALLKHSRAIARTALVPSDGTQYAEALSDLRTALSFLAPALNLGPADSSSPPKGGKTAPSAASSRVPAAESMSNLATPRSPPAGTFPASAAASPDSNGAAGAGTISPPQHSIYGIDVAVMYAAMLTARDRHDEAFPALVYAVEASRAIYGPTDAATAAVTSALAAVCLVRNNLPLGEQCLRQTIAAISATRPQSEELSHLMTNLAMICDRKVSSAEAAAESDELHKRNIALVSSLRGPSHPLLAVAFNNYAASLIRRNRLEAADTQLTSAIAILRQIHGTRPAVEVAETLNNIATLRRHQRRMPEAKANWAEALSILEAVSPMGRSDMTLAPLLENLAAWGREMAGMAAKAKQSPEAEACAAEAEGYERRIAAIRQANGRS